MKAVLIALTITGALLTAYGLFNAQTESKKFLQAPQYSAEIQSAWTQWRQQHGKAYGTDTEHAFRLANFAANYNEIKSINANPSFTWKAALNKFSDLTKKEFTSQYTGYKATDRARKEVSLKNNAVVRSSTSKDWETEGAVTPVKDQGACGSCWAFSATGAMEGLYYLLHNNLLSFSEQFFLNCDKNFPDMGCNGGNSAITMMWTEDNGIITEDRMPYLARDEQTCYWDKYTSQFFNADMLDVPADDNDELISAIDRQPISIAVAAEKFMHYSSGVFNDWTCGTDLDHAILAVGYGQTSTGQKYYRVKNSWNTSWGEAGYIRFERRDGQGVGICGITSAACYPTGENPKP